jgi:hypothetical protein
MCPNPVGAWICINAHGCLVKPEGHNRRDQTTLSLSGVHSAHLINGATRNVLLDEVFTDHGASTMISA